MLLALENDDTCFAHALLDADLFNLGCGSLGCAFRTGTPQMGAA